jgi:hypothetical protein
MDSARLRSRETTRRLSAANGLRACGLTVRVTANAVFTPLGGCHPGVVTLVWY